MTELEHPTGRRLSLDPAGPATVVNATDKHGYIAHPEPVVYVSTHDLPRIVEIAHVLPRSLMAQIDAFVAQLGKERVPLDLGIGERDHARDVAPTERIHDMNCQLHVRSSYVKHLPEIAVLSETGSGAIAGIERRRWILRARCRFRQRRASRLVLPSARLRST